MADEVQTADGPQPSSGLSGFGGTTDYETGKVYDGQGNEIAPGLDAETKRLIDAASAPRKVTIAGNTADLQVVGGNRAMDDGDVEVILPATRQEAEAAVPNKPAKGATDTTPPISPPVTPPPNGEATP